MSQFKEGSGVSERHVDSGGGVYNAVGEKAKKKADFSYVETRQVRWVMNEITNVISFY